MSIAAKSQTSVDDLVDDVIVVLRGNTVLGHASPNKQTEAIYRAHTNRQPVQMLQLWRDVVVFSS